MNLEARFHGHVIDSRGVADFSEADALANLAQSQQDSPSEAFNDEIDAWARRAAAANGFGDPA